jgi:hypothetical protein
LYLVACDPLPPSEVKAKEPQTAAAPVQLEADT